MEPERWKRVEELCHVALEHEESERATFLEKACAGDPALRDEVEALLAEEKRGKKFMEVPALEVAAKVLAQDRARWHRPSEPDSGLIGKTVSHYRILEKLGAGGMGVVYKAKDTRLGRYVALKFLPEEMAQDKEALERFKREARAASALNHPNICTIHDIDEHEGRPFIVMELLEGQTLKYRISGKPLPTALVLELGNQIAGALAAAHAKGITHRDVKPANIFVTEQEQVKLLDFGLAKIAMRAETTIETAARHDLPTATSATPFGGGLTRTGMLMGTAPYMSPEQVRREPLDAQTDLFSFGSVLYEMTTGQPAFSGGTIGQIHDAILNHEPTAPRLLNPRLPAALERLIAKAQSKKRQERYRRASELGADLKGVRLEMERRRVRWRNRALAVALGVLLVLGGVSWRLGWLRLGRPAAGQIQSIAVLPLENLSGDPAQEYFADGMTEELITDLAKIGALRVISRTSVMRYKGTRKPLPQIARELNVDGIIEGSVLRSGDQVRITAQLIDAPTDTHRWAQEYQRNSHDVLAMEGDVARAIADEIRVKLTPQDRERLAGARPVDPAAHDAYLRGRYYWNRRTAGAVRKSREQFQLAIDKDPTYAAAYVGLADAYNVLGYYSRLRPSESFPLARAAALKALEIDEGLGQAHASLAYAGLYYDLDWSGAETEYKRAIKLNPNYATAHHWYALCLIMMGRFDEAMVEIKRAQQLDPLSPIISNTVAAVFYFRRQYDQGIEQLHRTLDMDPNFVVAHSLLGKSYRQKGMFENAIAEFQKESSLDPDNPSTQADIAQAYAVAGRTAEARKILGELKDVSKRRYVAPTEIARTYAALGEKGAAFEWLQKALEEHDNWLVELKVDPKLDNLRSDPRFQDLLRRMNFPP